MNLLEYRTIVWNCVEATVNPMFNNSLSLLIRAAAPYSQRVMVSGSLWRLGMVIARVVYRSKKATFVLTFIEVRIPAMRDGTQS